MNHACRRRAGRTIWAVLGFLLLFVILLVGVSEFYLLPGLAAAQHATPIQKAKMAVYSRLLLAVLLVILLVGLFATFRVARFFFPRPTSPRTRTKVVDAWAESGRRAAEQEDDDEEDDDEDQD